MRGYQGLKAGSETTLPLNNAAQHGKEGEKRHGSRTILLACNFGLFMVIGILMFSLAYINERSYDSLPKKIHQRVRRLTASQLQRKEMLSLQKITSTASLLVNKQESDQSTVYTPEALQDEIKDLPGLKEEITFKHFSGYLNITSTKKIFYWYVESMGDPDTDPLVFWTNGGPGCSGLFGFMNENGPFRPSKDGKSVQLNPFSWNNVANMLFVEQPVTVGFSYTDSEKDLIFGDDQASNDNYLVIQKFLERFPHLRSRELHLSGESYAGHYLPTLAKYIVEQNVGKGDDGFINLQGFVVGNPLTDPMENLIGAIDSFWGHSLVPYELYHAWVDQCRNKKDLDTFFSENCVSLQNAMYDYTGGLNPYALDYPVCEESDESHRSRNIPPGILAQGRNQRYKILSHSLAPFLSPGAFQQSSWSRDGHRAEYEPCEDAYAAAYLNRKDVQAAIHAHVPPGQSWSDCSNTVFYNFNSRDRHSSMEPVYTYLADEYKKLRILIFSGSSDSVCSTQGTEFWLDTMPWKVETEWTPWGIDRQVAGYIRSYTNNVTFATVHNAGHEVPAYKPEEALGLFASYLKDELV